MRVVIDTNVAISGLLWHGPPRRLLESARSGHVQLLTSAHLLAELEDVLARPKLAERLSAAKTEPRTLVLGYAALAELVEPATIEPVVLSDPDDDAVLACAVAAQADVICSGDRDLLSLGAYQGIPIAPPTTLIELLYPEPPSE